MRYTNPEDIPFDTSLFRLIRALRLIKLLSRNKNLKRMMFTFIQSFKSLPYVGALIFLLFFVYSILGMHLFSHIDINQTEEPWLNINRYNNFRTFFSSFQVLSYCCNCRYVTHFGRSYAKVILCYSWSQVRWVVYNVKFFIMLRIFVINLS